MFIFRSARGESVSPERWVTIWSAKFDTAKYPENVYQELVLRGSQLSGADFEVLGAWKDGAIQISTPNDGFRFGNCRIAFNGKWSEAAASCAYQVWRRLPQSRETLQQYLSSRAYREFLIHLAEQPYRKASKGGIGDATFGLSRATYVLHMFSGGEFPIYDRNTHRGIHALTQGRYGNLSIPKAKRTEPEWYLSTFCSIICDLQQACEATTVSSRREIDKALFCYGKAQ